MINELTQAQKDKFPYYVDKWIKIGISTERANRDISEKAIKNIYALAKLKEPKVIWCPCPISGALAALFIGSLDFSKVNLKGSLDSRKVIDGKDSAVGSAVLSAVRSAVDSAVNSAVNSAVRSAVLSAVRSAVDSAVDSAVLSAVRSAVRSAVDSAVDSAVLSAVRSAVRSAVNSAVNSAVLSAVRSAVGSAVDSAVNSAVGSAVGSAVRSAVRIKLNSSNGISYIGGSLWSGYSAWTDFFNLECGIKIDRNYLDLVENCGYYFCLEGFCIATERPIEINLREGRLHKDMGMSIKYESGWGLYHLNGTRVPQYLAETNAEKLTLDFFKKENNADVKAEFIRKFGIERMVSFGKVIDSVTNESDEWYKRSEYQLIDMGKVYDVPYAPHLKMRNLTTGIFHLEGVSPDCKTIEDAIKFRCGGKQVKIAGIR